MKSGFRPAAVATPQEAVHVPEKDPLLHVAVLNRVAAVGDEPSQRDQRVGTSQDTPVVDSEAGTEQIQKENRCSSPSSSEHRRTPRLTRRGVN